MAEPECAYCGKPWPCPHALADTGELARLPKPDSEWRGFLIAHARDMHGCDHDFGGDVREARADTGELARLRDMAGRRGLWERLLAGVPVSDETGTFDVPESVRTLARWALDDIAAARGADTESEDKPAAVNLGGCAVSNEIVAFCPATDTSDPNAAEYAMGCPDCGRPWARHRAAPSRPTPQPAEVFRIVKREDRAAYARMMRRTIAVQGREVAREMRRFVTRAARDLGRGAL